MMRIWPFICVLFTVLSIHGFAVSPTCSPLNGFTDASKKLSPKESNTTCSKANKFPSSIEIKGSYFFFADAKMRKIYDKGGLDLQLSGSYPVWRWLQLYGSVEYLERRGSSLKGHQKTKIWEIPLSLGLRPVIKICQKAQYYLTLGPRYFFVHAHNNSSYVERNMSQNGLGGFVNTGFNFFPCNHLLVDVFGECSYKRMHFHSSKSRSYGESTQVGGFVFGVGLGYAF